MMEGNPYSGLAAAFSPAAEGGRLCFGTVTATEPVALDIGGLKVSGEGLFLNEALLPLARKAEIRMPTVDPEKELLEPEGEVSFIEPLAVGDRLLLYSDGDQVFYGICKVVEA